MFALSPATRFGYFAYPAGLYGFLALTGQRPAAMRQGQPAVRGRRDLPAAATLLPGEA